METPASLLERLRQPDAPDAWERLVLLYSPLIYSWARQVGLQETEAADLVQDVFVTLIQTLPTFEYDRRKSFRRWLRTIALNKWRDRRRKDERLPVTGRAGTLGGVVAGRGFGAFLGGGISTTVGCPGTGGR